MVVNGQVHHALLPSSDSCMSMNERIARHLAVLPHNASRRRQVLWTNMSATY